MNAQHFKNLLEKEVVILEKELKDIGRKSDTIPSDWEAVKTEKTDPAEDAEVAHGIENYDRNNAELGQLEVQLKEVKDALVKIEDGSYGACEECGKPIENDRLEANPSARTCKEHMS